MGGEEERERKGSEGEARGSVSRGQSEVTGPSKGSSEPESLLGKDTGAEYNTDMKDRETLHWHNTCSRFVEKYIDTPTHFYDKGM